MVLPQSLYSVRNVRGNGFWLGTGRTTNQTKLFLGFVLTITDALGVFFNHGGEGGGGVGGVGGGVRGGGGGVG